MAKIAEISVNYGLTKNLGNFESLRLDITLSAKIEDGEDTSQVWSELMKEAREKLTNAVEAEQEMLRNF